mmetsp:Transcript_171/g.734  ORF Transcript_171/g.734 Transcript_171/m.734 type:complete len:244 (-) Transcript_171:1527-2258(-)
MESRSSPIFDRNLRPGEKASCTRLSACRASSKTSGAHQLRLSPCCLADLRRNLERKLGSRRCGGSHAHAPSQQKAEERAERQAEQEVEQSGASAGRLSPPRGGSAARRGMMSDVEGCRTSLWGPPPGTIAEGDAPSIIRHSPRSASLMVRSRVTRKLRLLMSQWTNAWACKNATPRRQSLIMRIFSANGKACTVDSEVLNAEPSRSRTSLVSDSRRCPELRSDSAERFDGRLQCKTALGCRKS